MKLIFCPDCQDVIKLIQTHRTCSCGASGGHYENDGLKAVTTGKAISLGFDNRSLSVALKSRTKRGMGMEFKAFVIPEQCFTITHKPTNEDKQNK